MPETFCQKCGWDGRMSDPVFLAVIAVRNRPAQETNVSVCPCVRTGLPM